MTHRLSWTELPSNIQEAISSCLGSPVVDASTALGGYSPAFASNCRVADGRIFFVKAASAMLNPHTPDIMRTEAAINAALPVAAPAPRLLDVYDDGTWVVLVFESIAGHTPHIPWHADELSRCARALASITALEPPALLRTVVDRLGDELTGFSKLRNLDTQSLSDIVLPVDIDALCALEATWPQAATGDYFGHGDVRSDNIMLSGPNTLFVDWTSCFLGAPWLDAVFMAPSVEYERGASPEQFLHATGQYVSSDHLLPVVAALAGYFAWSGTRPAPLGMPTVRAGQKAKADITMRWLRRLLAGDVR